MSTSGWGRFPVIAKKPKPFTLDRLKKVLGESPAKVIPRGQGKSYGDSALADTMLDMTNLNQILSWDPETGVLNCEAGISLSTIIDDYLPKGWLPSILPGTKHISLGGAIASDIHGKNHLLRGSFSEIVLELEVLDPKGNSHRCSKSRNMELFHATCGGMGLTGPIVSAKIQLDRVNSRSILCTTRQTENLQATLDQFEHHQHSAYSVAWIDCLAQDSALGKGIFEIGEHAVDEGLNYSSRKSFSVPINLPSIILNRFTISLFNNAYYHLAKRNFEEECISIDQFFFPLDAIRNWNRIHGEKGFIQYQFVLPLKSSANGFQEVLERIQKSNQTPCLAVLKRMGSSNKNLLSFARSGYTLAIDFKLKENTLDFLNELDQVIHRHGGRFYLAKDARLTRAAFEKGYPTLEAFRIFRRERNMHKYFASLQSERLGL